MIIASQKNIALKIILHFAHYQWDELLRYEDAEEIQGLCPPGWHVPTAAEWNTLFANWTNNALAGAPLKYSGYSGFNAFLFGKPLLHYQLLHEGAKLAADLNEVNPAGQSAQVDLPG